MHDFYFNFDTFIPCHLRKDPTEGFRFSHYGSFVDDRAVC